ncbi:MAG: hypothetical protein E7043_00680 [Lentisphaerae bacterium]|nr:hypothetical protein [Lentisphaerota bacterium]
MKKSATKILLTVVMTIWGTAMAAPAESYPDWRVAAMTYAPDYGYKGAAEKHYFEAWGWRNEKGEPIQFYPEYFTEGGMFEISFIYCGKNQKLPPLELLLDGVAQSEVMKQAGRNVVWYRISPASPRPGQVVHLMIRFRRHPEKAVKLQLAAEGKILYESCVDVRKQPRSPLVRLTMDDSMRQLNFWVKNPGGAAVEKVLFDGIDFSDRISAGETFGGITPVVLQLPEALIKGTHHTLIFECGGVNSGYRFQAHPNKFYFAIYSGPHPENMKWHHFDVIWSHGTIPVNEVVNYFRHGIGSIFMIKGDYEHYRNVPGVIADYLTDEPDVGDYLRFTNINPPWLRLGSNAPGLNKTVRNKNEKAQSLLNLSTINGTFKPGEYYNYARITDIVVMDPYAVSAGRKVSEVYDLGNVVRAANEPGSFWTLIGCYAYKNAHWKRFPNREELHYMARGAVAAGTQSLGYWMYVNGSLTYGPVSSPETWYSMGLVNGELKNAAHLLRKSYQVGHSIKLPAGVSAHLLRTIDDEATMLMLINTGCVSDAKGITIPSPGKFRIETALPPGKKAAAVYRMSLNGPVKLDKISASDAKVAFEVDEMTHSAFYIIPHSAAAAEKIENIWNTQIKPNNIMAEKLYNGKKNAAVIDLKDYLPLINSRMIAPETENGGTPESMNGAFLEHFQGQTYRRAGMDGMTIQWNLPAEAGDLFIQYSSKEMCSIELISGDNSITELMLEPVRRTAIRIRHDGKNAVMKLNLRAGVAGRSLYFVPREKAESPLKINRKWSAVITGDEPCSKEKAEALSDGNFVKGPRWSNSRNRLGKIRPMITLNFPEAQKLKNLVMCGWNNQTYGLKAVGGTVFFADGSSMKLQDRQGFTGGRGIWYRKYIFWWSLPDKAVSKVEFVLTPNIFSWIDIGEIICISRD